MWSNAPLSNIHALEFFERKQRVPTKWVELTVACYSLWCFLFNRFNNWLICSFVSLAFALSVCNITRNTISHANVLSLFLPRVSFESTGVSMYLPTKVYSMTMNFAMFTKESRIWFLAPRGIFFNLFILIIIVLPLVHPTCNESVMLSGVSHLAYLMMCLLLNEDSIYFWHSG